MKTILFFYHTSSIGGGSFCLLNILKTLDRQKFNPIVLLCANGSLVAEIESLGIKTYFMKGLITVPYNTSFLTPRNLLNSFKILSSLKKVKFILSEIKPDIVYVNTMMLYPFLLPAKQLGAKTIIHIREHWPDNEHIIQRKLALRQIDRYADYIVAINSYSLSMFNFSERPKSIIYDWIELNNRFEEFPLSKVFNEPIKDKKIYLYLGGLQSIKGPLEIASAFTEVVSDSSARLLMMGINDFDSYNNGLRGLIKWFLRKFNIKTYSGKVFDAIKNDKRIKCIPSRYKINHIVQQSYCILSYFTIPHANLALAESIILGTPTIAAKTEESLEYSLNGELASLFELNNFMDFKQKMQSFDNEYTDLLKRIDTNRKSVEQLFDSKRNSELLNSILLSL